MSANDRWFRPARTVLLTGAGFTKGFGGYLANEMWAVIFRQPEIQGNPALRNRMLEELDYESTYTQVLESAAHSDGDRQAFKAALGRAYQQLHDIICPQDTEHTTACSNACQFLLTRFAGKEHRERGFIFTLNQDLFVEKYYAVGDPLLTIPGLTAPNWFNGQVSSRLTRDSRAQLPDAATVEKVRQRFWTKDSLRFVYVKLHGSFGWQTNHGSDVLVVGHSKSKTIQREPLLEWYFSLFEEVLHQSEVRLVVIGYGFGDAHINEVIADSIRDYGLRLYVVSPEEPARRRTHLVPAAGRGTTAMRGAEIWKGLAGYFCASATDLHGRGTKAPEGKALFVSLGLE